MRSRKPPQTLGPRRRHSAEDAAASLAVIYRAISQAIEYLWTFHEDSWPSIEGAHRTQLDHVLLRLEMVRPTLFDLLQAARKRLEDTANAAQQ